MNSGNTPNNNEEQDPHAGVMVRDANMVVWGPIYITLNLEKSGGTEASPQEASKQESNVPTPKPTEEDKEVKKISGNISDLPQTKSKKKVDIISSQGQGSEAITEKPQEKIVEKLQEKTDNTKKVTYVYNMIDHGLNCECIDVKGELLIRSALPTYRKISSGIEFEQITSNQIKLIITSRVLENYQEVFQGFTTPKATFRIWIIGYKFAGK